MFILILFAFFSGIVTILSPCILPVLPIVLSSSLTGGKRRPLGIVTGFVISFTFFTLFLSAIVRATNISADSLRTIAVVLLIVFGASLFIPQFQLWMEKLFSKIASLFQPVNRSTTQQSSDFIGGIPIGASLGLIWAPCVGPILASVITIAATSTVTSGAFFITLAYSLGTGIPMLGITYGGRTLLQKVPWLLSKTQTIQRVFGFLMFFTAIGIFFNVDRTFQT
jgi:cytochrome c biogenesis protein CcdA